VSKTFVKEAIAEPKKAIIFDVREAEEFFGGNIPTSTNISVRDIYKALKLDDIGFKEQYKINKPTFDEPILFYCRSGQRSRMAGEVAEQMGYKNVYDYSGSWIDWSNEYLSPFRD
jgi:rhodanese-related sulfurtransferase